MTDSRSAVGHAAVSLVVFLCLLGATAQAQIWQHEAPGATVLSDWPYAEVTGGGWTAPWGFNGILRSDSSSSRQVSPPTVIRKYRDANSNHGGDLYYDLGSLERIFVGFTIRLSNPHYGWFDGWYQKIFLIEGPHTYMHARDMFGTSTNNFIMCPDTGNANNDHIPSMVANATLPQNRDNRRFNLGEWHKIEMCFQASTNPTSQNGIVRWWVDGILVGDHTNVNQPRFTELKMASVWDSINRDLPQEEWIEYDHVRLSLPSTCSPPVDGGDATAPLPPRGVTLYP